jgi:hypothetical protein
MNLHWHTGTYSLLSWMHDHANAHTWKNEKLHSNDCIHAITHDFL